MCKLTNKDGYILDNLHELIFYLLRDKCYQFLFMSPVSPVFYTEATVSTGLKNVLRVGTCIL